MPVELTEMPKAKRGGAGRTATHKYAEWLEPVGKQTGLIRGEDYTSKDESIATQIRQWALKTHNSSVTVVKANAERDGFDGIAVKLTGEPPKPRTAKQNGKGSKNTPK